MNRKICISPKNLQKLIQLLLTNKHQRTFEKETKSHCSHLGAFLWRQNYTYIIFTTF